MFASFPVSGTEGGVRAALRPVFTEHDAGFADLRYLPDKYERRLVTSNRPDVESGRGPGRYPARSSPSVRPSSAVGADDAASFAVGAARSRSSRRTVAAVRDTFTG